MSTEPAHEVVDLLFALQAAADDAANALRPQVEWAQELLDCLERIATQAEDAGALVDSSLLCERDFGQAFVPDSTGLIRPDKPNGGRSPWVKEEDVNAV